MQPEAYPIQRPEMFLTSNIPKLQPHCRPVDIDSFQCEIHADRSLMMLRKDVVDIPAR